MQRYELNVDVFFDKPDIVEAMRKLEKERNAIVAGMIELIHQAEDESVKHLLAQGIEAKRISLRRYHEPSEGGWRSGVDVDGRPACTFTLTMDPSVDVVWHEPWAVPS